MNNENNNTIEFIELLSEVQLLSEGKISIEDFNKWTNKLIINLSLPLISKKALLINLLFTYVKEVVTEFSICELYKNLFFHVYLGAYCNVVNIDERHITDENYDLLEPIIGPIVENVSGRDITIFKEMISSVINSYDIRSLVNTLNNLDYDSINEQIKSNKELMEYINKDKELINNFVYMTKFTDPLTSEVVDEIKEEALIYALDEYKKNKDKDNE